MSTAGYRTNLFPNIIRWAGPKNLEGDEWGETIRRCYNFPQTTRRYERNIHQLIENFQIERPERNPRQNLNFLN